MSIVSCPRCADPVVMPEGASPSATVRCPLCQEEFQLLELLDAMPPTLIVVDDPKAANESTAPEPLFFADAAGDRPVNLLDEVESDSPAGAIAIEPMGNSAAPSATPISGGRRRAAPRPQRKKKSPAMEVVKVFLGGIAGLVIAQAILWWLPWTKYRRDPFELGPKVSSFAGWMVPEQFHGKGKAKPAEAGGGEPAAQNPGESPKPLGNDAFGLPGTGLPQRTFVDPNEAQDDTQPPKTAAGGARNKGNREKKQGGNAKEPAGEGLADGGEPAAIEDPADVTQVAGISVDPIGDMDLDTDLFNMIDPTDEPIIEEPILEEPTLEEPTFEEPVQAEPVADESGDLAPAMDAATPVVRITNAPEVSGAELRSAIDDANTVAQAWSAAADPADQRLIAQSYRVLAKLAEAVTFAETISGEQKQTVSALLASLVSKPEQLSGLKMVGPRWPAFARREGAGILLVGKVVSTEQEGDIYVTTLDVAEGSEPMAIYQDTDPAADWPAGESIVVLGAIVDDPANRVPGYAGDAAMLIWAGQSQVLAGN